MMRFLFQKENPGTGMEEAWDLVILEALVLKVK